MENQRKEKITTEYLWSIVAPTHIVDSKAIFMLSITTYRASYMKLYKTLKMNIPDETTDKIYQYILKNNISLKTLLSKKSGREYFIDLMSNLYKKQFEYLEKGLEKFIEEASIKYKPSEGVLIVDQYIASNSIGVQSKYFPQYSIKLVKDEFFLGLLNQWDTFRYYYNSLLQFGVSDYFLHVRLDQYKSLRDAYNTEREYYLTLKNKKNEWYEEENSINVYRNFYILARNLYLKYYYVEPLVDGTFFVDIKKYECCIKKDKYSLKDIALIYRNMLDLPSEEQENDKIYNRMKKIFSKKIYTKKFYMQERNEYEFSESEIYEGIAAYMFLKKKNIKEEDFQYDDNRRLFANSELDKIIHDGYARFLELLVKRPREEVNLVDEILKFYKDEFYMIFGTINNEYQKFMVSELMESFERLYALYQGLPKNAVYLHSVNPNKINLE